MLKDSVWTYTFNFCLQKTQKNRTWIGTSAMLFGSRKNTSCWRRSQSPFCASKTFRSLLQLMIWSKRNGIEMLQGTWQHLCSRTFEKSCERWIRWWLQSNSEQVEQVIQKSEKPHKLALFWPPEVRLSFAEEQHRRKGFSSSKHIIDHSNDWC